jgi:hypothetical protein
MRTLALVLKLTAPIFLIVGAIHLVLGVGADVALGAQLPAQALSDPALNSQNRFFGVTFALYGVLQYLCATDLRKYSAVFHCLIWMFFAGGLARVVSVLTHGAPPALIIGLLASELALPPVLAIWFARAGRG